MSLRNIGRQILGTFVALLAGWCAGLILVEASAVFETLRYSDYAWHSVLIETPIMFIGLFIYFTLPVWLLLLVPLYLFVPSSSVLWRLPVCTLCGAASGYLILLGFCVFASGGPTLRPVSGHTTVHSLLTGPWFLYLVAAVIGGVTCFFGALTGARFKRAN
jgi:hypothetical protein